jgi:hypothetical protein
MLTHCKKKIYRIILEAILANDGHSVAHSFLVTNETLFQQRFCAILHAAGYRLQVTGYRFVFGSKLQLNFTIWHDNNDQKYIQ